MKYPLRDEAVAIEEKIEALAAQTKAKLDEPLGSEERKAGEEALHMLRRAIVHWERFCGPPDGKPKKKLLSGRWPNKG